MMQKMSEGRAKDRRFSVKSAFLCAILSALWILTLPQMLKTVYADPIVVNDDAELLAAIDNAVGDIDNPTVIKLGANIEYITDNINIDADKHIHLDLNDKALSVKKIDVRGDLTVEGSGSVTGVVESISAAIVIGEGGKLTLSGGNISGTTSAVGMEENSTFVMTGGRIDGNGYVAVLAGLHGTRVTMSGGTIITSSGPSAVRIGGTMNMTGGTIINTSSNGAGIQVNGSDQDPEGGQLEIRGGTIENTAGGRSLYVQTKGMATQKGGTIIGRIYGDGQFDYKGGVNDEHPAPGPAPTPKPSSKDTDDDKDEDEESPAPAPKPVNPNAVLASSFISTGISAGNVKIGPQIQGAVAQLAFRIATPAGWRETFTFNMTINDKADYSLKKGTLSFKIPSQYLKAGRKFAILGLDKNGKVRLFNDIDTKADTITVNLDIEGYAFDLIYTD